MDEVLVALDHYLLEPFFYNPIDSPYLAKGSLGRDVFGVWFLTSVGGAVMYLSLALLSYIIIYDKSQENDKRFLKNQKLKEMGLALTSIPIMGGMLHCILFIRHFDEIPQLSVVHFSLARCEDTRGCMTGLRTGEFCLPSFPSSASSCLRISSFTGFIEDFTIAWSILFCINPIIGM